MKKLCNLLFLLSWSLHASAQISVQGVVLSAADRRGIGDVTVSVAGNQGDPGVTDSEGNFTLHMHQGIALGQVILLRAQRVGFVAYSREARVAEKLDFSIYLVSLPPTSKSSTVGLPYLNPDLAFLVAKLGDSSLSEKLNAISELGKKGAAAQTAAPYLADLMIADKQGDSCIPASDAILRIGFSQPLLIDKLFQASNGPAPIECRIAATRALGSSGQLGRKYLSNLKVSMKYETPMLRSTEADAILKLSAFTDLDALFVGVGGTHLFIAGGFVMDSCHERRVRSSGSTSRPVGDRASGGFVPCEWSGEK
jgi:hypothetical protein